MQTALRTTRFQESMIREMTRLALQFGAINLSQGYPDFDPPPEVVEAAVHDFLTICAPTPLQAAAVAALSLPASYYDQMLADYHRRRDLILASLAALGLRAASPEGAYYVMAAYDDLPLPQAQWDALSFARWLTTEVRVAVVPGGHFYADHRLGEGVVRFAFCKRPATLQEAARRMHAGFLRAGAETLFEKASHGPNGAP